MTLKIQDLPKKRIGIALAAYQPPAKIFFEQLRSIQTQTHANWICSISFDSDLNEIKVDPLFKSFFEDSRFSWHQNLNRLGPKKNFESAAAQLILRHRQGEALDAIAFSDQDDIWYPEKLERCLEKWSTLPPYSLVHSDMDLLMTGEGGDSFRLRPGTSNRVTCWEFEKRVVEHSSTMALIARNVVAGAGLLMDVRLLLEYPVIPDLFPDHDYWYAILASKKGQILPLHTSLYAYRQHASNVYGASAYQGIFSLRSPQDSYPMAAVKAYQKSRNIATALNKISLLSLLENMAYLRKIDLGWTLACWGIITIMRGDLALARSFFAKAAGKFFSSWKMSLEQK